VRTELLIEQLILPPWWAALAAAAVFALLARGMRLLTTTGAIATFVVGYVAFGLGGGKFTVPLIAFFLTSSLLSRIGRARKSRSAAQPVRGATRDYVQVLANGGAAAVIVIVFRLVARHWPIDHTRYLLMLYLAALATVNADTWATEIGGLSALPPRLLSSWKPAPAGASGAVTLLGVAGAFAGSLFVTAAGWLVWRLNAAEFIAVCWAGFLGSFVDSLLGASVQALYRHPATGEPTERNSLEGVKTVKVRGIAWMNNDAVNFVASLAGIGCAWLLLRYCAYPFR
jgi:uncharacterized protein (TIGR00297 family)